MVQTPGIERAAAPAGVLDTAISLRSKQKSTVARRSE